MAYNRRNGGYSGYGGGGSGGGGRYNSGGGYRAGAANAVNPWQSNTGVGGPMSRQTQQSAHPPPAQLAMASNIISKLLTSSNSMSGSGYGGGPNRSSNWGSGGTRMSHMGMRRQDGPGGFNKDNRRRGGEPHNRFSGGGRKSGGMKDDKRKHSGKVNDETKKGQNEREKTKEQLDADKKASYVGVPSAVLYCHVCSKHMWDSESFEKHVRGRPHELMMTYLDEAYKMRVDFMRHQIKAVENQREIDLERVTNNKHKSNSGNNKNASGNSNASKPLLRSYCPMCDVRFYGPLTGHRKSDRHRKLKQFLHPECKLCDALFHTRLEMDEHKLTAGHLKKVAEVRNVENPQLKDNEFDLIDMIKIEEEDQDQDQIAVAKKYEMLNDRDATKLKLELEGGEKHREKKNSAGTDINTPSTSDAITNLPDANKDDEENIVKDEVIETSDIVATADDDLIGESTVDETIKDDIATNMDLSNTKDNQTFTYDPEIAIGKELLVSTKGFVCRLCNCFLLDEQRVSIHCQTAAHYINYTTMTKMKEAAVGNKKRSIDQLNEEGDFTHVNVKIVNDGESTTAIDIEKVACEEKSESVENPVKRIKLEHDDKIENSDNMDTSEQSLNTEVPKETETMNVEDDIPVKIEETPVIEEKPAIETPITPTTPARGRGRGRGGRGGVARRGRR